MEQMASLFSVLNFILTRKLSLLCLLEQWRDFSHLLNYLLSYALKNVLINFLAACLCSQTINKTYISQY